ncbi:aminotransferase class III-fold pyridoxal phosphate-dependent enzyme, partial [Bacillus altitudinis]|uniref:aminotransferase class III-fold pyridoxal phosphate-dependent enzyme n=1 Tax=Bacillus altitudinis TaxID=293387 RepID=UPI003B51B42A
MEHDGDGLGEVGIVMAWEGFIKEGKAMCEKEDVLLIGDEIEVGLGGTGKMFARDCAGIEPDMVILAKALVGG